MTRKQMDQLLLCLSIGSFAVMSISFLLMPIDAMGGAPGVLFWGGLLLGILFQITLETRRRSFFAKYRVNPKKMQKPRNGFLTFSSNKYAKVADRILLVSVVCTILAFLITRGTGYLCFVFISISIMALCMHCILNGRIFFHVMNQTKVQQVLEQKKVRTFSKGEVKYEK